MISVSTPPRCWVIVPAAGRGERMQSAQPKQYLPLAGATVLEHALKPFIEHPRVAGIVVALAEDDVQWQTLACARNALVRRTSGGDHRMHSVLNGLNALAGQADTQDWALVHDAARPCLARKDLDRLFDALQGEPVGGLLALPMSDTVKRADTTGQRVAVTIDRRGLWSAQTPQMFRFGRLLQALRTAADGGATLTDEASAIEAQGLAPRLVEGSPFNLKVTTPRDLVLAEAILQRNPAS
jgi:2-C-methyl-D-erythritol 4-phosphate cytidylyltransferase